MTDFTSERGTSRKAALRRRRLSSMIRLPEHSPVEYAVTSRYLEWYIPGWRGWSYDVGVGGGCYLSCSPAEGVRCTPSMWRYCLTPRQAALEAAGLAERIERPARLSDASRRVGNRMLRDAVLYLDRCTTSQHWSDRQQAVREAAMGL